MHPLKIIMVYIILSEHPKIFIKINENKNNLLILQGWWKNKNHYALTPAHPKPFPKT